MRILALSNLYPPEVFGGYEIACSNAVNALRERGHEVRVITSRPGELVPAQEDVKRLFHLVEDWNPEAMGRHQVTYKIHEAESRFFNAYNVHVLLSEIEDFDPDVLYISNLIGLGGLGLLATIQYLKIPWVWRLGDCIPRELCSTAEGVIPDLARRFGEEVRGEYIAVSQRVIDENEVKGIKLKDRVTLLPFWIEGERPKAMRVERPRDFRNGETLRIMSAGRVHAQKGSDLLIEAAAKLIEWGCSNFEIDFYGHVSDPSFHRQIRSLGLGDHVRLHGFRSHEEILELYGEYDVFAFPTQAREPFGVVPIEAASRGCLPVITDSCGVAEWLVHGVHCLKAKRKPEAFAKVFQDILEGKIQIEPMIRRARDTAWNDFHLSVIAPKIESLLLNAAAKDRTGAGRHCEAYRMARMAEQISSLLIQESLLSA